MMRKPLIIIIFFLFIFNNVFAISKIDKAAAERIEAVSTINIDYEYINNQLLDIEKALLDKTTHIKNTNDYIKILGNIEDQITAVKDEDETNLNFVRKRIESLGEKPENNLKEEIIISNRRKEFNAEENLLKTKIAKNDLILTKVDELEKLILSIRNKTLLENILNRQADIINTAFFIQNTKKFINFPFEIIKIPSEWYKTLDNMQKNNIRNNISNIALISILLFLLTLTISLFIKKYFGYKKTNINPDYISKIIASISIFISNIIIPSAIIGVLLFFLNENALIKGIEFNFIFIEFLIYIFHAFLLSYMTRTIFVPQNSKWRLINISDEQARSINFILIFSIILISIINFFEYLAIKLEYQVDFIVYIKILSCLIKIFCIFMVAKIFFYEKNIENEDNNELEEQELDNRTKIKFLIYLFAIIIFFICFAGYVNLAYYILNKSIISIVLMGIAYISNNVISVLFHRILLLKFWVKNLKFSKRQLVKIDVLFTLIINPVIMVILIFALLGLWGVSTDLLLQNIKRFLTSFYVGDIKISIISILIAIFTFFVSLSIFKIIKLKLLITTLSKTDMDIGIRDSLASGFSFFGFLASGFFAIAVVGGNFGNLAIIAGALSFGIGLGLQNIVNNFVSGILILFERPIRIGDIVNINDQEGVVKQINIRSTQLETGTKASIIIPNSNIISGVVINKTLNNKQTRVDLNFTVDCSNKPEEIMEILLNIANNNKRIMQKPLPFVSFNNFSNNNLDFTLKFYINDINNQQDIINEIMIEAFNKFNEMEIKLQKQIIYVDNKRQ